MSKGKKKIVLKCNKIHHHYYFRIDIRVQLRKRQKIDIHIISLNRGWKRWLILTLNIYISTKKKEKKNDKEKPIFLFLETY